MTKDKIINADTVVVVSERMAGFLMFCRFHKIDEKMDLKNPDRLIYIFKNSKELKVAMSKYNDFKELL